MWDSGLSGIADTVEMSGSGCLVIGAEGDCVQTKTLPATLFEIRDIRYAEASNSASYSTCMAGGCAWADDCGLALFSS